MTISIQILLPTIPKDCNSMYYRGYVCDMETDKIIVFITQFNENNRKFDRRDEKNDIIFGYYDSNVQSSFKMKSSKNFNHFFILEQGKLNKIQLKTIVINGRTIKEKDRSIIVYYDYDRILESEVDWEYNDNLSKLQSLIHSETGHISNKTSEDPVIKCPSLLSSSMFIQHVINYYNAINWLIKSIKNERKISIKQGNFLLAILMDLFLGYIALQYLTQDKSELSSLLMGILEKLINMLYSLLKWLMGAPAGLKLNNAFNKMLGKYFSYHVQLWWLFLDVSGEKLDTILHVYHYLGYLGFTFQAAVISDMICIATFHSYCIYVYAARMFNIQISGLIALLRFFVGRKYNPLRGSIDSCEYTNQELFVGTVAFTILLLLLPTTLMYYIVFTVFRVLSLLVQYALAKLINFIHTLPLYVSVLWLIHSPKVAGNVLLEVDDRDTSLLTVKMKLHNKSIFYLINNFRPPVEVPTPLVWKNFLSNVFIGKQII